MTMVMGSTGALGLAESSLSTLSALSTTGLSSVPLLNSVPSSVPLIASTEGTTLIWFMGFVLLAVLSLWLSVAASRVMDNSPESQSTLWLYFVFIGVSGLIVGSVGTLRVALGTVPTAIDVLVPTLLFGFVFACALTIREAQFNAVFANTESERFSEYPIRRIAEIGIVVGIVLVGIPPLFVGPTFSAVLTILLVPAVIVYGVYYFQEHLRGSASHGTLIDTLVRHVLLTLVFLSLAVMAMAVSLLFPDSVLFDSLGATFLLIGTSSLVGVLIKCRQHASSL
jgi:hypothetical protein